MPTENEPTNQPSGVGGQLPMDAAADKITALLNDEGNTDEEGNLPVEDEAVEEETAEEEPGEEEEQPEEEEEEESPESEEEAEEPTYTITVDGKKETVTLEELKSGYQRGADYTRKTQSLANERRQIEQTMQQAAQERDQYARGVQQLQSQMVSEYDAKFKQVDWNELKETDPIGYMAKRDEMREMQERYRAAEAEKQRVQQQQQIESVGAMRKRLDEENKLLEMVLPEFKDPEQGKKLRNSLRDYALSNGYSEDEVSNLYDHRAVVLLDKARRYDQIRTAKPNKKKVVQKSKSVKPGTTQPVSRDRERLGAKMKRLHKEQSVDAAGDFLSSIL